MFRLFCRRFPVGRKSRPAPFRPSRPNAAWQAEGLEPRALLSVVELNAAASPMLLQPISPQNQPVSVKYSNFRPVTVAGSAADSQNVTPGLSFRVIDEYGRDEPAGRLLPQTVRPGVFFFQTRFELSMVVRPGDRNGRQYTIIVTAQDQDNTRTTAIEVTTPQPRIHVRPHPRH